jgi:restriction system protein
LEDALARGRGFFAEMQHQSQVAARQAEQRQRAADAANRRVEKAQAAAQRAVVASQRASEADRKRLEREAVAAHIAAMQAQVDENNAALASIYEDLDNLLKATLDVDDFVDLERLRQVVDHPPFDRIDLKVPVATPTPIPDPIEPTRKVVEAPKGFFGKQKKLEEAQAKAEAEFVQAWYAWHNEITSLPAKRAALAADHAVAEAARESALVTEVARYASQCEERERAVTEHNSSLDDFIANLGYGAVDAVQEYVGIVLANSVYPEHFEVGHDASFEPATAELSLKVLVPGPDNIPTIKAHKYTRASDDITTVPLSQKESKGRYANVIHQVALRTIHEVFEADRRNLFQAISLEVGTEATNPATGKKEYVPLVAVSASRDRFMEVELSAVVPAATLEHLGAAVSKSPFDLVPASGAGVRRYQ